MAAQSLKELYEEELRDLISANNQMHTLMTTMADRASDANLKALLQRSVTGIQTHTQTVQALVGDQGQTTCRAMEGLVQECTRHAIEADLPEKLRDIALIAQYQRMSHYGIAGFGTAAAYATALGSGQDAEQLRKIVADIYRADEYTSQLAALAEQSIANQQSA